ncbi:MAG: hypothetical protein ACQESR_12690 [Planctomycetota bacterium]
MLAGQLVLMAASSFYLAGPPEEPEALADYLMQAYQQWLRDSSFACTYKLEVMKTNSRDGHFGATVDGDVLRSDTGTIVKDGKRLRYRSVGADGSVGDLVHDGRVQISLHERGTGELRGPSRPAGVVSQSPKNVRPSASVNEVEGRLWGTTKDNNVCELSPVNLFLSTDPFGRDTFHKGEKVQFGLSKFDDRETVLTATSERLWKDSLYKYEVQLHFDMGFTLPVVTEKVATIRSAAGQVRRKQVWSIEDYQLCSGGIRIPRKITRATWDQDYQRDNSINTWMYVQWTSADLGKRLPTDEDFAIRIPADAAISGLKSPPASGKSHVFRLTDFALDDLVKPAVPSGLEDGTGIPDQGEGGYRLVALLVCVCLLCILVFVFAGRRMVRR